MSESKKPRVNTEGQRELEKVEDQIKTFSESMVTAGEERASLPVREMEPQTKLSQSEINKSNILYLKPKRTFPSREKFNEKYRADFNYQSEYVDFIAENHEVKGESIDFCVKKFPGQPIEEWVVPVNKEVSAPRYVKERIQECGYTIFTTADNTVASEGGVKYYGQIVAEERRARLSAREISRVSRISMSTKIFS
jgi:hypothetical protein